MNDTRDNIAADPAQDRRLFVYNGGFFTQPRIKRILKLSGYAVQLGAPSADDLVGVWGNSPTSHRGEAVAEHRGAGLVRVEDAWLRSLFPGREGEPPCGLVVDTSGVHYEADAPSDLETLLATHPLDDTALLDRARGAIERLKETHLTKYAAVDPTCPLPSPGYVLVIDQTKGDASVKASGADRNRFLEMLFVAQEEHPGAPIIIKTHPETVAGHREGYFTDQDLAAHIEMLDQPVSPWALMEGAVAVYTVSSQLGFEAIFAGHKPRVFGAPFYAGWGLTQDEFPSNGASGALHARSFLRQRQYFTPSGTTRTLMRSAALKPLLKTWRRVPEPGARTETDGSLWHASVETGHTAKGFRQYGSNDLRR